MNAYKALLTVKEAAASLSISQSKFYQLIAAREIHSVKIGRSTRIPIAAIEQYVASLMSDKEVSR